MDPSLDYCLRLPVIILQIGAAMTCLKITILMALAIGVFMSHPEANAAEIDHANEYNSCMALAQTNPNKAFSTAIRWRDLGGGEGADHCAAVALIGLEQYREAAGRLEELALDSKREPIMKAQLLGQASQAWKLDGNLSRAESTATAAVTLDPVNAELLVDRAEARALLKDYKNALVDLNTSLKINPGNTDALVFRATTKRFLEDITGAAGDIVLALRLDRAHPEALLERGILRRLSKNDDGAREDWLRVLSIAPDSGAAKAAQSNLELMDVKQVQ
jgi:tetratricopeptide (TPR) repeat protein